MKRGLCLNLIALSNGILDAAKSSGIRFWVVMMVMMSGGMFGQQIIGSFPTIDGGFENQISIVTRSSIPTGTQYSDWSIQNITSATAQLNTSGARSGSKHVTLSNGSTAARFQSPTVNVTTAIGNSATYTIQFYYKTTGNTAVTNIRRNISPDGTATPGTYTATTLNGTNGTWTLAQLSQTSGTSSSTPRYGIGIIQMNGSSSVSFDIDDFVIYAGAADNTAPNSPSSITINGATTTSLNISWGAASGGVDGGGYIVVRYSSNPNTDNDPNQKGIYNVGNTTINGTGALIGIVKYIGTGTSFTDTSLSEGTTYYYKVYSVDKAFNYSDETSGNATTLSANSAPTATSVSFSGTLKEGNTLTGTYTYADAESNPEGTSTFKWYRANDSGGTGEVAIGGATSSTYLLTGADVGKYIRFSVVPVATAGTLTGTETFSSRQGPILANVAPTATSVNITGTTAVGQTLTGNYTYADTESNPQGTSTFKWYRADDASGTGEVAIGGATATTYMLAAGDFGKYIRFSVIPVATAGTLTGVETFSPRVGAIAAGGSPLATLTGTLAEATLNTDALEIDLTNTTFVDNVLDAANFTLNNAPAGLTIDDVLYDNSTRVLISFTYDNTDFDADITNFSITIAGSELATGSPLTTNAITVTATTETLNIGAMSAGFGNQCLNQASGQQTFTISGTNLKAGNISLAALTGFAYSEVSGGPYTSNLSFAHVGGNLSSKTIYVVFTPTLVQSYNGNIAVSGGAAPSVNRSVTGSGVNTIPTITTPTNTSITSTTATLGGNITALGCSNVTERGVYWSTTNGFADGAGTKVSATAGPYSTGAFTQAVTGLPASTTVYFKAFATNGGGTAYTSQSSFVTATPLITLSPTTLTGFTYSFGSGPSTEQTFTASGTNLISDITIAPSTNYEISTTTGSGFGSSITLTPTSGTVSATTIYVRLKAGLVVNTYNSETLTATATTAANKSVTCSGSVTAVAPPNNLCANAEALTINASATNGSLAASTFTPPFTKNDVWYKFVPLCTVSHSIIVTGFSGDVDVELFNQSSNCPTTTTSIGSATTSNATETITTNLTAGITYYVRVLAYDSAAEGPFTIRVTGAIPGTSTTITPTNATTCVGVSQTYTATAVTNATSYTWSFPSGWVVDAPSTTNVISVTPSATTGNVSVTATNCYGSGVAKTLSSTPATTPATPGAISGSATVCEGSTSNSYTITTVSGATSYTWTLPSGWSGTSTTNSISATAGSSGGNITVTANNACGSSSAQTFPVTVTIVAAPTGSISVVNSTCGTTTLTYSAPNANLYWQTSSTGTSTANPTTSNYGATASSPVYVRNFNGSCWSVGNITFTPTVNIAPGVSVQPASQSVLVGATATFSVTATGTVSSYQWQVNTGSGFSNVSTGTGGTTASYTTVATTVAMNGYTYQCIINGTSPCGNVTSSAATLSVVNEVFDYNNYLSTTGTGGYATASTWCQCKNVSGCTGTTPGSGGWSALGAEGVPGASHTIFVQGNVTGGTTGVANATILSGGTLTTSGVYPVSNSMKVKTGGALNISSNFTFSSSSATFTIEANATVTINTSYNTPSTSIWNGVENFDAESIVRITNWNKAQEIFVYSGSTPSITPKTQNGYTAFFGYLFVDTTLGDNWTGIFPSNNNYNITHNDLSIKNNNTAASSQNITLYQGNSSTLGIGRDFIVNIPSASNIVYQSGNGTPTFYIKRDFIKNGTGSGEFRFFNGSATKGTLNIDRDFLINEGVLALQAVTASGTTYETNLKGNLTIGTNAVLKNTNTTTFASSAFNFNGTTQNVDIASTVANENSHIYFYVKSGATVKLTNNDFELGTNSKVTVEDGGTLDFGFNSSTPLNVKISGSSTSTSFEAKPGSTLKITSANGITTSGSTGNVQTTTRIYATGGIYGNYHYIGKTDQNTGNALPANVRSLTINTDPASDVTLTQAVKINNTLTMTKGNIVSDATKILELGSTAANVGTLAYTAGYVKGYMKRWFATSTLTSGNAGLFPLGVNNEKRFARVEYTVGPTAGGSVTAHVGSNPMLNVSAGIVGVAPCNSFSAGIGDTFYWTLEASALTGGKFKGTFEKTATAPDVCEYSLLNKNATNVPNWDSIGTHLATTSDGTDLIVSRSELSKFGDFGIGKKGCLGSTKVWNGTWVGGNPTLTNPIKIETDLGVPAGVTVVACECIVAPGKTLTIASGASLEINNAVIIESDADGSNPGKLIIENGGSLVQDFNPAVNPTTGNSKNDNYGKIDMIRISQPVFHYDFTYWSSPVEDFKLGHEVNNSLSWETLADKFYGWDSASQQWYVVPDGDGIMVPGAGYPVRAPQSYPVEASGITPINYTATFKGRPNNGIITYPVHGDASGVEANEKWNLIGNPYPSALDIEDFLTYNNTLLEGTIYLWTHNTQLLPTDNAPVTQYSPDDYATYNFSGGVGTGATLDPDNPDEDENNNFTTPTKFLGAGQSFFVKGISSTSNQKVTFNNDMRPLGSNGQFFKPAPTTPVENWNTIGKHRVWLNLTGGTNGFNQAMVGYIPNATNGLDWGYDGDSFGGNTMTLYSLVDNKKLVIQGRALPFSNQDVVPLGYKSTVNGTLKISIDHYDGLFQVQDIYLEDLLLNVVHNLKTAPYSFTSQAGTFNNRFVLRYQPAEQLGNPNHENIANGLIVYKDNGVITIKSQLENLEQITVFDLLGRIVFDKAKIGGKEFEIHNVVMNEQPLIVKAKLVNGQIVNKKIVY